MPGIALGVSPSFGLAPVWTPKRLAGLALWLAADHGLPRIGLAASFNGTDEQLTATNAVAPNTTVADTSFFVAAYFRMAVGGATQYLLLRGTGSGATTLQYSLRVTSGNVLRGEIGDSTGAGVVAVQDATVIQPDTPHLAILYHDHVNDVLGLSLDGAAPITTATGGKVPNDLAGTLRIGARAASSNVWNGAIDSVAFAKDPPGGMAALVASLPARWWNGGSGLPYAAITADEKTAWGLISYWGMEEASDGSTNVSRADGQSGYTLTSNNTVPSTAGIVYAPDVSTWADRSDAANDASQATAASRPLWTPGTFGAKPGLVFDGANDALALTDPLVLDGDFTLALVVADVASGAYFGHSSGAGKVVQTDATTLTLTNDAATAEAIAIDALDAGVHDLTVVRSGTAVTAYLDGLEAGAGTLAGTITVDRIGVVGTTTTPLDGALAEVVAYTRAYAP